MLSREEVYSRIERGFCGLAGPNTDIFVDTNMLFPPKGSAAESMRKGCGPILAGYISLMTFREVSEEKNPVACMETADRIMDFSEDYFHHLEGFVEGGPVYIIPQVDREVRGLQKTFERDCFRWVKSIGDFDERLKKKLLRLGKYQNEYVQKLIKNGGLLDKAKNERHWRPDKSMLEDIYDIYNYLRISTDVNHKPNISIGQGHADEAIIASAFADSIRNGKMVKILSSDTDITEGVENLFEHAMSGSGPRVLQSKINDLSESYTSVGVYFMGTIGDVLRVTNTADIARGDKSLDVIRRKREEVRKNKLKECKGGR